MITSLLPMGLLGLSILAQALSRGGRLSPRRRAGLAIAFQFLIGASLLWAGAIALTSGETLHLTGPTWRLNGYDFAFAPALYLDARNGLLLIMLGLTLPLVFLWLRTTFVGRGASFFIAADVLSLGLVGAFLANSLLLFYVCFEVSLIGAYFWIGIHNTAERAGAGEFGALTRFLLFTLTGSLAMLVSIAAIIAGTGQDARILELGTVLSGLSPTVRLWTCAGFGLAFAVKMPLFPFHGWMRETYQAAPAAARAILSAAMSKLGAYGFLMILIPGYVRELAPVAGFLQVLAVTGVFYGALMCFGVKGLRDVLIYSSLTHLSLIALAVFSGLDGTAADASPIQAAFFQVFNHGLIMAALFALEGRIATHAHADYDFGGLRSRLPRLAAMLLLTIFVAISLPGTGSFAAEILILFAAYRHSLATCALALLSLLIAAAALVRAYHRNFLGDERGDATHIGGDLSLLDCAAGVAMAAIWILTGVYPMLVLGALEPLVSGGR